MQVLKGRRHLIQELVFSHCGRWLAAAGGYYGGGLHVWDTANPTAKPLRPLSDQLRASELLAFRSDGNLFFSNCAGVAYLYAPATDTVTEIGKLPTRCLAVSPDGERIVRVFGKTPLCTWRIPADGEFQEELVVKCPGAEFATAAFSRDGSLLATTELYTDANTNLSFKINVRTADGAKLVRSLDYPGVTHPAVCFSADGSHLLTRSQAGLACWDLSDTQAKPRKAQNPSRKHFLSTAVHPGGYLLTVDNDRLARVWDVPALTTDRAITWGIGKLHTVAVSPDGTRAAVGSHTGKVLVWDWD